MTRRRAYPRRGIFSTIFCGIDYRSSGAQTIAKKIVNTVRMVSLLLGCDETTKNHPVGSTEMRGEFSKVLEHQRLTVRCDFFHLVLPRGVIGDNHGAQSSGFGGIDVGPGGVADHLCGVGGELVFV